MSSFEDYLNATPASAAKADSFEAYIGSPAVQSQQAVQQAPIQSAPIQSAQQPGLLSSFGAGLGHGLGSTVLGAQQLLGRGLTAIGSDHVGPWLTNDADQGLKNLDQQVQPYSDANPITTAAGKFGGNVVGTAPLAALAPEAAAANLWGRLGTGAVVGAAGGLTTPVQSTDDDFWGEKAKQAAFGGGAGAAGSALANALGRTIRGFNGAAQQRLADAGVTMTPGQVMGGAWARNEDRLTSVPLVGDIIKNAQQRSVQSFNRAAYDNALAPIGQTLPRDTAVGSDAVSAVRDRIGSVYQSIEPRATFVADQNFATDLSAIRNALSQQAPSKLDQFDNIVKNQVTDKLQNGSVLTGQQWGNTRSQIGSIARNQRLGSPQADNLSLADALGDLNDAINSGVGRASPPDVLQDLSKANAAYARYKQIENAAGSVGASNNNNIFSAAQFQSAIRKGSTGAQKATNSGLSGQLGDDAQSVLGKNYPDSGTPGRAALMAALGSLGGGGLAVSGYGLPALIGGTAAAIPYTALGQRATQALLMSRPQFAQSMGKFIGERGSPFAAALGAALANH